MLLSKWTTQLSSCDDFAIQTVNALLSLALFAIVCFEENYPDSKGQKKNDSIEKALGYLDKYLRAWVDKDSVIGKQMFGGSVHKSLLTVTLVKSNQEIKVPFC